VYVPRCDSFTDFDLAHSVCVSIVTTVSDYCSNYWCFEISFVLFFFFKQKTAYEIVM